MLKDLDNITFRFLVVDKRTWTELLHGVEDIISTTRMLPKDPPDTDTKSTILYHCQELLGTILYTVAKEPYTAPCIGSESELFYLFEDKLEQDELALKVEHPESEAWAWGIDYPCCWGTISKSSWTQITDTLGQLVSMSAEELSDKVKSVDYVLSVYKSMKNVSVGESDIIVFQGIYEEEDLGDY